MEPATLLTGATSGFGAATLKILARTTDQPLIVGARDPAPVIAEYGDRVTVLPLDLSVLKSVQAFCESLKDTRFGCLGLNAGLQTRALVKTEDGFERTFQTNFLSHLYIFERLKDQLTETAIVATTGSGTHDPDEKTPVPPPKHANIDWLAYPEKDPDPDRLTPLRMARAYSTSKLLCILMTMEIAKRHPNLKAVSFDPGYLPDTRLAREHPALLTAIIKRIIPFVMKNDRTGSVAVTAPEYARVLTGDLMPDASGGYIVMRSGKGIEAPPSTLARTPDLSAKVWDESLELLRTYF